MSAFSVENSHDGKIFENYTRFEWGVELGVVAIFMLRLFVPHEFDMHLSETFVVENIRCKHRQIMQHLIFELRSRISPIKSRGRP